MEADGLGQFILGLADVDRLIESVLEVDAKAGGEGIRECGFPEFMNRIVEEDLLDKVLSSLVEVGRICRSAVFDIRDGISEEEIKVRIERVRGLVSTIMYQKAGISNLLVEESYLPLKNSLLELLNKTLSEISRFLKKFTILLEIDQEDMPEDRRIKIEFDPEVEGEASLFGRQLAKSEWKYKNDKSL